MVPPGPRRCWLAGHCWATCARLVSGATPRTIYTSRRQQTSHALWASLSKVVRYQTSLHYFLGFRLNRTNHCPAMRHGGFGCDVSWSSPLLSSPLLLPWSITCSLRGQGDICLDLRTLSAVAFHPLLICFASLYNHSQPSPLLQSFVRTLWGLGIGFIRTARSLPILECVLVNIVPTMHC